MIKIILITGILLLGCDKSTEKEPEDVSEPSSPSIEQTAKRDAVTARILRFLDRGFVVSLRNGAPEHQGDSLLFSGLALYALDCAAGEPIAVAFEKMLSDTNGGAYRHPDQGDREVSLDGLLGFYRGIAKRITKCGEKDRWASLMKNTRARIAASMPAEFNLISAMMDYRLGFDDVPDMRRVDNLASEVATWALLVRRRKAACYRIHLGLLALQTMEELGAEISDRNRAKFAEATKDLSMAAVDNFSRREGLSQRLTDFKMDVWAYEWQRCPLWEAPDGYGMEHPAVDYLVGYADLYKRKDP